MKKLILKHILLVTLMFLTAGIAGYVALEKENGEGFILSIIAALGFMYTIIKPISEDIEFKHRESKALKVSSIYSSKDDDFEKEINARINSLKEQGHSIVKLDILSKQRAIIQYIEK